MKCKIPEMSWHNRDPVLTVDMQLRGAIADKSAFCRLATGGADTHVIIWYLKYAETAESEVSVEFAADLTRHQRAVNAVRWSPDGKYLASADDESAIIVWKLKGEHEHTLDDVVDGEKETWLVYKILRGHTEDIYDVNWSPDSLHLVSGSVDNTAIVWDVHNGRTITHLSDHKGYVQGVAWDPRNNYIATLSTDRHLRVFDVHTKKLLHRVSKAELPVPPDHELSGKSVRLFYDGTLQTYFRRLTFTPDGSLLLAPAGLTDYDGVLRPTNVTYGFSRIDLKHPAFAISSDQYAAAVSCSPLLYKLRPHDPAVNPPMIDLPYRMVYAIANKNAVHFYDTQQDFPFAIIANMHYTRLADLVWSGDGQVVVVASTDGFCSLITFAKGELGEVYEHMDTVLNAEYATNGSSTPSRKKKKRTKLFKEFLPSDENAAVVDSTPRRIEVKRKPKEVKDEQSPSPANHSAIKRKCDTADDAPKPIAIKRRPGRPKAVQSAPKAEQVEPATDEPQSPGRITEPKTPNSGKKTNFSNILALAKQLPNIVTSGSSEQPAERSVTPIPTRRENSACPVTPGNPNTPGQKSKKMSSKTPNRIEVRRTPRTPVAKTPTTIKKMLSFPPADEEANQAWQLEDGVQLLSPEKTKKPSPKAKASLPAAAGDDEETLNSSQDLQLVYDATSDEEQIAAKLIDPPTTPTPTTTPLQNRTPRRITPRMISKLKKHNVN